MVARKISTSATPVELALDGETSRFVISANTAWSFTALLIARNNTNNNTSGYEFKGVIKRDGANNTTIVGSVVKTVLAEDDSTTDANCTADDTNEALQFTFTGVNSQTYRAVVTVWLTQVKL
jgi:hypothetical protein